MRGKGRRAWQGGMYGKWVCMARGFGGGRHAWQGCGVHGGGAGGVHAWQREACMAGGYVW